MPSAYPMLVMGAAGRIGGVGGAMVEALTYLDAPLERWRDEELRKLGLPEHLFGHLLTMAKLHTAGRYDHLTHDVEVILGRPATSARDFVARHAMSFAP
jgi:hypothetical protein